MESDEPEQPSAILPIRSVERACAVMTAFTPAQPQLTLGELVTKVALPKATVYRLAASLIATGFMSQSEDGRYGLGFRLLELGAVVREGLNIVQTCAPVMAQLSEATGETVLLSEVDWPARELIIVHRVDSSHTLSVLSPVGRRSPIPPGALGKALLMGLSPEEASTVVGQLDLRAQTNRTHTDKGTLLAELEHGRELGYVVEQDEYLDGVSGVAVPVVFEGGRPLAALAVVGPSTRVAAHLARLGEQVRDITAPLRSAGEAS